MILTLEGAAGSQPRELGRSPAESLFGSLEALDQKRSYRGVPE